MSRVTEAFVEHARSTRWESLPEAARAAVKIFLLDTIGVGIAGSVAPLAQPIRMVAGAGSLVTGGVARCLGGGMGRPQDVAFVNGFQIHCQEFDCVHEPAVVHPMATILAALLAECDAQGCVSGPELGAAISVAVDLATGLGVAAKSPIRFFRPATAGIFGATLGVAKLKGMEADEMANALGYALAFASGTMQAHAEGKPALPVQIANAASGAVRAAELAQHGVEGPQASLDGPFGYLTLFEEVSDLEPVLAGLGRVHRITEVSHKPFPTGRAAQGGIVLMQRMRRHGVAADEIESLQLLAPPLIRRLVGRPLKPGMDANYARLCFQYSGAVAYLRGAVGLSDFTPDRFADADIFALGRRIQVLDDGDPDPAAFTPQTLHLRRKNGADIVETIDTLFGSPADPLSPDENQAKFRNCVAQRWTGARGELIFERLVSAVSALETLEDARTLTRLASGETE